MSQLTFLHVLGGVGFSLFYTLSRNPEVMGVVNSLIFNDDPIELTNPTTIYSLAQMVKEHGDNPIYLNLLSKYFCGFITQFCLARTSFGNATFVNAHNTTVLNPQKLSDTAMTWQFKIIAATNHELTTGFDWAGFAVAMAQACLDSYDYLSKCNDDAQKIQKIGELYLNFAMEGADKVKDNETAFNTAYTAIKDAADKIITPVTTDEVSISSLNEDITDDLFSINLDCGESVSLAKVLCISNVVTSTDWSTHTRIMPISGFTEFYVTKMEMGSNILVPAFDYIVCNDGEYTDYIVIREKAIDNIKIYVEEAKY